MGKRTRVSAKVLTEMAIDYMDFFGQGNVVVRLNDTLHGGRHCIHHLGTAHVFKTNRDAYGFMEKAIGEERVWR